MKRLSSCVAIVLVGSLAAAAARALPPAGDVDVVQQAYVKASNSSSFDHFGDAVAADGDTVVVNARGVGAVSVFVRTGAGWTQQADFEGLASDAVAIAGDTLVVGAPNEAASGMTASGAAYVFVREGSSWSPQGYLTASNPAIFDHFGYAVAISGDTIAVGAFTKDAAASDAGAAYVFVRDGETWTEQAYLLASNPDQLDKFGVDVDVDGDTLVVGSYAESSGATGVNGSQGDDPSGGSSGAAYVFVREGETWTQQAYLKASNTGIGDHFGTAVALSGDTIVIGAPEENSSATGIDPPHPDDGAFEAGAAYVFTRTAGLWSQQAYVKASNTGVADRFGESVSVSGDTLVVGAGRENSRAKGINGPQQNETAPDAGAAYLFVRQAGVWSQHAYIKASNTGTDDTFGFSAEVAGDLLVVGAYNESGSGNGIDAPDDDEALQAGAAYIFDLGLDPWLPLGFGLAGAAGVPWLSGSGTLETASPGTLTLTDAAPSSLAMFFLSLASTPTPFKCGTLATVPVAFQLPLATNGAGAINLGWGGWPAGLSGLDLYFQYAIQDGAAHCGVSLSNALQASVP